VESDRIDWDEKVADVIAHFSTGEYGNTVELKNEAIFLSALITVHEEIVQIALYNIFGGERGWRRAGRPFFTKTINYANPDAFDGSLTKEIEEVIHSLPVVVTDDGIEIN